MHTFNAHTHINHAVTWLQDAERYSRNRALDPIVNVVYVITGIIFNNQ